jgi:hypothetical protein
MKEDKTKEWIKAGMPLSVEVELELIRKKIISNYNHKGNDKLLIKAAYNEIRKIQGKRSLTLDCGACMRDMNLNMKEWFKLKDKRTTLQKQACLSWFKPKDLLQKAITNELVPIKKKFDDFSYWDLCAVGKKTLPSNVINKLWNKGKPPKQKDLISELINNEYI